MKLRYLLLIPALAGFFSCNTKQQTDPNILNEGQLPSQLFSIDINKDTVLITANGSIIKIPKGSLQSDSSNVQLEIKEALTNEDIVLAGLTTMSGQQALSSGGMIYFNAASGYKVEIKKAIEVAVPTKYYNRNMQVFKGEKTTAGKIDWKDPVALPEDETTKKLDAGKALFINNCSSCHKIDKEFTGPALYGITDRKSKNWLYQYTNHRFYLPERKPKADTAIVIEADFYSDITDSIKTKYQEDDHISLDELYYYHQCQQKKYGSEMTAFNLSVKEIENLYAYIKNETDKRPDLKDQFKDNCCDSCVAYQKAKIGLQNRRDQLVSGNENSFSLDRQFLPIIDTTQSNNQPISKPPVNNTPVQPQKNYVKNSYAKATYYTINITTVGWYNIDVLMKGEPGMEQSQLMVRIRGNYTINFNVNLIIPSKKAFIQGGKLKDGQSYGFDEDNGNIPLPQDQPCTVLAFGETDDGKIIYGQANFTAQLNQSIEITVTEISKDGLITAIKALKLDDINIDVNKTKNANEIKDVDKQLQKAEQLKPRNCDCDPLAAKTSAPAMPINTVSLK
jgi:mono/diheme cytochrome c family protein